MVFVDQLEMRKKTTTDSLNYIFSHVLRCKNVIDEDRAVRETDGRERADVSCGHAGEDPVIRGRLGTRKGTDGSSTRSSTDFLSLLFSRSYPP